LRETIVDLRTTLSINKQLLMVSGATTPKELQKEIGGYQKREEAL